LLNTSDQNGKWYVGADIVIAAEILLQKCGGKKQGVGSKGEGGKRQRILLARKRGGKSGSAERNRQTGNHGKWSNRGRKVLKGSLK
jgi:hypothetical protein